MMDYELLLLLLSCYKYNYVQSKLVTAIYWRVCNFFLSLDPYMFNSFKLPNNYNHFYSQQNPIQINLLSNWGEGITVFLLT